MTSLDDRLQLGPITIKNLRPPSGPTWVGLGWRVAEIVTLTATCILPSSAQTLYKPAELLCRLEHHDIVESSGLAASQCQPGLFWTHNDSGDEPRIFAFDEQGRHRGTCRLDGAEAIDWEDMGSFKLRGSSYLFLADVGDNGRKREHYTIYLVAEPGMGQSNVAARPLHFQYEDGSHDCEAVALDTTRQVFILVEKVLNLTRPSRVYELGWKTESGRGRRIARQIGHLQQGHNAVHWVTGLDISPDGRRAAVATYVGGLEYGCEPEETWRDAFAKPPQEIALPGLTEGRRQGEAICYGLDGVSLYLSSEKYPCPLFVIHPAGDFTEP